MVELLDMRIALFWRDEVPFAPPLRSLSRMEREARRARPFHPSFAHDRETARGSEVFEAEPAIPRRTLVTDPADISSWKEIALCFQGRYISLGRMIGRVESKRLTNSASFFPKRIASATESSDTERKY